MGLLQTHFHCILLYNDKVNKEPILIWFSLQIVAKITSLRTLTSYPGTWRVVSDAVLSFL